MDALSGCGATLLVGHSQAGGIRPRMSAPATAEFLAALGKDNWPARSYAETHWPASPAQVPASYVLCLRDGILPVAWQERFAARLACDRVIRIDAGHQVMNSRPQALAEILRLEAAFAK